MMKSGHSSHPVLPWTQLTLPGCKPSLALVLGVLLSIGFGGLGLCSLAHQSWTAFIASLSTSGCSSADTLHLIRAVNQFNDQVSPSDVITAEGISSTPVTQQTLSKKLESHLSIHC